MVGSLSKEADDWENSVYGGVSTRNSGGKVINGLYGWGKKLSLRIY